MFNFKLFLEGMNVTLVNDRSEHYIRNQLVFFDRKWMLQLRFFLGTKFDKLFDKEGKSKGRLLEDEIGMVNIGIMETALKERLKELSKYVKEKEKNKKEASFLTLIYDIAVLDINREHDKPLAVLGKREKQLISNYYKNKEVELKEDLVELLDKNIIPDSKVKNLNKKLIGSKKVGVLFDLFFCAGGVNDKIREKYLGKFCYFLKDFLNREFKL